MGEKKQLSLPQISGGIGKSQESFHKYPPSVTIRYMIGDRALKISISLFLHTELKQIKTTCAGMEYENNWKQGLLVYFLHGRALEGEGGHNTLNKKSILK